MFLGFVDGSENEDLQNNKWRANVKAQKGRGLLNITGKCEKNNYGGSIMKKKVFNKLLATMMIGTLAVGMLAGCGQKETVENKEESSQTAEQEDKTPDSQESEVVEDEVLAYPLEGASELSIWVSSNLGAQVSTAYTDASESPFHTKLAEKTGVNMEWIFPTTGTDAGTAYNLMLQEEELPNIILYAVTAGSASELYEDGLIYDLTEYLPVYAPDYWAYLNNLKDAEDVLKSITTEDGKHLFVATLVENDYNVTWRGPVIRKDWLDECGLEVPVTLEDWENVLVAFKEKYDASFSFSLGRFVGGIASGTGAQAALFFECYVDEDGNVQCANTQEEWKESIEIMKRWYDMGLIDPDFTSIDDATLRSKVLNNEVGVSLTALSQLTNWIADAEAEGTGADWIGMASPRTAEGEPTCKIDTRRCVSFTGSGGLMVSTSTTEEELIDALKWMNYGFTEEGLMYWNYGEEGVSYTLDENGEVQWTELVAEDPDGLNEALKKYAGRYGGGPSVQLARMVYLKNAPSSADAVYAWTENTNASQYCIPSLSYSTEDQQRFVDLYVPMDSYVYEMSQKFVIGEESMDNFDDFVDTLYEMGLEELLEIQQAAYDDYLAK